MANALFHAYLRDAPEARPFFSAHFSDREARRAAAARAFARPMAPDVAEAVRAQNARLPPSRARSENLEALANGAAALVSGQQVGLFLGPLYTVYKAASAVRAAEAFARETGRAVVPVFWLQTEDHDLVEIATCHVPCARGSPLALSVPASAADRVSIAHRLLPQELEGCLAMLATELAGLPHAQDCLHAIQRHYRPGATFGGAFAGMLAELFEGLVLVDPRDSAFDRVARSVHRTAIAKAPEIADALIARNHALEQAGFEVQVHVRPGSPLSFHHPEGAGGPRFRIEPAQHTTEELLAELDGDPLAFSTSVLLRPILQDSLLPTIAYVGGPAEVAYFGQLAPVYAAYDLQMPLVLPRARLRAIEEKTARILSKHGLSPGDAELPEDALLQRLTRDAGSSPEGLRAALLRPLIEELSRLGEREPGIEKAIEKTRSSVERSIDKLMEKYQKMQLHRDQELVEEMRRLKLALLPEGVPQERFYSLPYFLARYGREFLDRAMRAIDPFDPEPKDFFP